MRLSHLLLPTERQPPADAEALSHKLMVRAGLIRQVGAGLWSWLPAGWRVHEKVVQIIREEMDAAGGQEMLMPVLLPAELWKTSGRYETVGPELMRLHDRRGADMVLAMTHEEAVTFHVAQLVRSYRELPMTLYHFQTKERDEARPRAGLLRTREFIMKDAYTFDRDEEGLAASYEVQRQAYHRVFERCGLHYYEVESDVGMMGGSGAHEFMAPCAAGENEVALAAGYAANVEVASAEPQAVPALRDGLSGELHTPGQTTVAQVAGSLGVQAGNLVKAFPVVTEGRGYVVVFVRGDHRINEIKLTNALGEPFRAAREDELHAPGGYLGPPEDAPALYDAAVTPGRYVAGGNRADHHQVIEVTAGERLDVRTVEAGDTVGGHADHDRAGHRGRQHLQARHPLLRALGATYLDESGRSTHRHGLLRHRAPRGSPPRRSSSTPTTRGSPGRGDRAVAGRARGPGQGGRPERAAAEQVYASCARPAWTSSSTTATRGRGEVHGRELLGVPLRLTLGKRSLESGTLEAQRRRGREDVDGGVPLAGAAGAVEALWRDLP
jgi:prolyl-tRNA synthetase